MDCQWLQIGAHPAAGIGGGGGGGGAAQQLGVQAGAQAAAHAPPHGFALRFSISTN